MENQYNLDRLKKMEQTVDELEQAIHGLEKISERRSQQINGFTKEIANLEKYMDRMEKTLLKEFKISQDILKSILDHEWQIDKAKLDLKLEIERKEQELQAEQMAHQIKVKKDREAMKKDIYFKLAAIGLPILTAAATGISLLIQQLFEK